MQKYILPFLTALFLGAVTLGAQSVDNPCSARSVNLLNTANITQSSFMDFGHGLPPHDKNDQFPAQNVGVVFTENENSPWWQANLSAPAQLEAIQFDYSESAYPDGLKGLYILYSAYPMAYGDLESLLKSPAVHHIYLSEQVKSGEAIPLGKALAKYVRIQAAKPMPLRFSKMALLGNEDRVEIPNNGLDDDCDGYIDASDDDLNPVFLSVVPVGPSCPECRDAVIHLMAGGNNLAYSLDGGQTFEPMETNNITIPVPTGTYNLVLVSEDGGTNEYGRNPVRIDPPVPDISTCANGNFDNGFTGWTGGIGTHFQTNISYPIDPATNLPNTFIAAPNHLIIPSGANNDPNVGNLIPLSSPSGQAQFVRLGNSAPSTGGSAQRLTYSFTVNAANADFSFAFAAVMWQHSSTEDIAFEPFFTWTIRNANGGTIATSTINPRDGNMTAAPNSEILFYHPWECVFRNLSAYIGQTVTVQFETTGCGFSAHSGYAYIDGLCAHPVAPLLLLKETVCGTDGVITAYPLGGSDYSGYTWTIEKLDANGNPISGQGFSSPILHFTPIKPFEDVLRAWKTAIHQAVNCNDRFRVTLDLIGWCPGVRAHVSAEFQVICSNSTLDYCDIAVCNSAPANIQTQATGSCAGCTFEWSPAANLSSTTAQLPTVANPAALGTHYQVSITSPNGCTVTQTVEIWDASLPGTLTSHVRCVSACEVKLETYFLTSHTINVNRVTVTATTSMGSPNSIALAFTEVQNLANGVKKYIFNSAPFGNAGTGPNGNTPVNYTITMQTTVPSGFCGSGNCPSVLTNAIAVPRGLFYGNPQVYVPNVFAPNDPNPANHVFNPFFNTGDAEYSGVYWINMQIWDMWGALIYEDTLDLNPDCSTTAGLVGNEQNFPWDGMVLKHNHWVWANEGVYVYVIKYKHCTIPDGGIITGDVLLLF